MRKHGWIVAVAAVVFLAVPAQAGGDLASRILACAAETGDAAQLACYNRIAAGLKASAPSPQPPAPAPRADFAHDSMPFVDHSAEPRDQLTARVTAVSYSFYHSFTVVLDNGQIWRQEESDTSVARIAKGDRVTIARGFLGSFHLTAKGRWGSFAVRRIK